MGASKWLMFFVCIYLTQSENEASSWISTYPTSVKGLLSSCVVIPCSFNYPDQGKPHDYTGIWYNPDGIIFHSKEPQKMLQKYKNRIVLVGKLEEKNCSLKIDTLQQNDIGPFNFRIEIKNYESYSYKNKVSISVISNPNPIQFSVAEDIKVGQKVSASCSVSHSCPASPPAFKWSHSGEEIHQSQHLGDAEWNEKSILTFNPTHIDHNKTLQCTVTYKGGKKQEKSKILHVRHPPVNVKVEYKSNVSEGDTVDLTCSSEAHPPVSRYEWHNETGANLSEGNLYVVSNVSRNIGAMYCTAINNEGQASSKSVLLNVLYAPEVKTESSCFSEGNWVKCECIVDSNPPSTVTFKLGDRILPGAKNVQDGSFSLKVLWKDLESYKFVQCLAVNIQGRANLKLFLPHDGIMLYIFIASGVAGLLLIILLAVGVIKKCRGTSRDTSGLGQNPAITHKASEPAQMVSKRKEICDDPPYSDIYLNENMYGNVGFGLDDQIYANV
uniref:Si:dkey-238d18.5 n=1 Tax=Fundulus heteroclitus TaxID=8078 RepID=A0A3Q2QZ01_FUNHE